MLQKDCSKQDSKATYNNPVHARVFQDYFRITSVVSCSHPINYRVQTSGLKRGLRQWLDVKDKRVLDLGCGLGEICWLANHMGAKSVVGVNLSQGELDFAKPYVQAQFYCQDIYG